MKQKIQDELGRVADLGCMDADIDGRAVRLFTLDTLNVDDVLLAVHLDDLADLLTLVVTPYHL